MLGQPLPKLIVFKENRQKIWDSIQGGASWERALPAGFWSPEWEHSSQVWLCFIPLKGITREEEH